MSSKSKKPKPEKEKKEKLPKLPLRTVIKDILFVLKIVHRASPWYMPTYFGWSVAGALLSFLSDSYLLRYVINEMQEGGDIVKVLVFVVAVTLLTMVQRTVFTYISRYLYPNYQARISAAIQEMLFHKASEVELGCYEDPKFYDKYVKVMANAYGKAMEIINNLDMLIWGTVSFFANAALIVVIDPVFLVFAMIPFLLGFLEKRRQKLWKRFVDEATPHDRKNAYIRRAFYLADYAKEMRMTPMSAQLFRLQMEAHVDRLKALKRFSREAVPISYLLDVGMEVFTILGAITYAAYQTLQTGRIKLGDCLVVFNSVSMISWSLSDLIATITRFHEYALYIEDFRFFLAYEPKISANPSGKLASGGVISLKNVSFRYAGAETDQISEIDLTIHPGEKIALVGCNGSGKTTLTKLLLNLYTPTAGSITLNGIDASEYELSSWRRQFGVVFQDLKAFSLSVAENVLLRPLKEGDEETVIDALKKSGAWEKVESLPKGIHTILTREFDDEGAVLSGGETQKVALARIFAIPTPIVILDEPTSALDPIAEYQMFENMLAACQGRTLIFISHRLSSAVLADRVVMMDGGRIIESGSHAELMERGGHYAEMFRKQAENYLDHEEVMT